MLKLFSCKRPLRAFRQELPPMRPDLRDVASTIRMHVSPAASGRGDEPPPAAPPRREPVGVYVMVDNFS